MAQLTLVLLLLEASVVCFLASASVLKDKKASTACGLRPVDATEALKQQPASWLLGRIIGGRPAKAGQYPWQARLSNQSIPGRSECGGVIIDEYWILTAAHCVNNSQNRVADIVVHVGDLNRKILDEHEQQFKVKKLIIHEMFNTVFMDYDIALLKLEPIWGKGIQFNDYVKPIHLPEANTPYIEGKMCLISGWGETKANDSSHPIMLQGAEVPIYNEEECRKHYKPDLTPRMVCAGFKDGKVTSCKGDSGTALACNETRGYTVMGVTSWGDLPCGTPNTPAVYVRVTKLVSWIAKEMRQ